MGFIADVGTAAVKTITAPIRFVGDVARMATNAAQVIANVATGDTQSRDKNLRELGQASKDALFSGVTSAFLVVGGLGAIGASASLGAAFTTVGSNVAVGSTMQTVGGNFMKACAETKRA